MIVPLLAGAANTLNVNPIVWTYRVPGVPCKQGYSFWPCWGGDSLFKKNSSD